MGCKNGFDKARDKPQCLALGSQSGLAVAKEHGRIRV